MLGRQNGLWLHFELWFFFCTGNRRRCGRFICIISLLGVVEKKWILYLDIKYEAKMLGGQNGGFWLHVELWCFCTGNRGCGLFRRIISLLGLGEKKGILYLDIKYEAKMLGRQNSFWLHVEL